MSRRVLGVVVGLAILAVSLAAQQPPAPGGGRAGGAQGPPGRGGPPGGRGAVAPPTAQASSPVDLTGYWVAVVTEDWEWRMVTPKKGDYASVPLSAEGRKVADQWDVAQDGRCEAYGAAGLMRMPVRLHITWQDDNTLKIDSDGGQQTRLFHFGAAPPPGAPTLQGHSVAEWDRGGAGFGRGFGGQGAGGGGGGRGGRGGAGGWAPLKVTTTNLAQGWLRRNGVPYSEQTRVTEHFIRFPEGKDEWMTVVQQIEDPRYLSQTFYVSSNFKREADGSRFKPSPCRG